MQETLLDDVRSRGFSQTPARRRRNAAGYGLFALLIAAAPSIATDLTWFDRDRLSPQARELMTILQDAESYGLQREDYELGLVEHERQLVLANRGIDADVRWRVDAALTAAAARFLDDVHDGRISPREVGFDLPSPERKFDAAQAARELARARDVGAAIAALEPRPAPYALLKQALRRYRELAKQGDLQDLPALPKRSVKPGEDYAGAPQLRKLLIALGDLDIESAREHTREQTDDALIDEALVEALRNFQGRHGLEPDGVLGPRTYAALTVPLQRRVRQIELTLERWRWTNALPRPDIVVNIPQFFLFALPRPGSADSTVLEMPVIVGRDAPHTRTPVFMSEIRQVIFQPFWDVPASITRRELLPLIRRDPSYLERHQMEIVRGAGDNAKPVAPSPEALADLEAGRLRLRQRPGTGNALGSVKFVSPNPYNVYLHATPHVDLFERTTRAFSHGCIRVSQPAALAAYVLENAAEKWTLEAIEAAICDPKTRRVSLATPVRVMMFYGTAVASRSRGVLFFEDIYGHDRVLESRLRARR